MEDNYIQVRFEPYQLKTISRVMDQAEIDIDSDDEDALIL